MKQNIKSLQELPEELKSELLTLYNLGIESYEVEYILSIKKE